MLVQTASSSPVAPAFPPHVGSVLHPAALTVHEGGKKAHPTDRAGSIRARQFHGFPSRRLQVARLLSTRPEQLATCGTRGTLCLRELSPVLCLAHLYHVLEQLGPQLVDLFIHCRFDLGPCRLWVLFPPLREPQHVLQSSAHGVRICGLRSRLFFLAFMLLSLS